MNTITKTIIWIFLTIILGLLTWLVFFNNETMLFLSHDCAEDRFIKNAQFNGVVTKKFLDAGNHNLHTIYILDKDAIYDFKIAYDEDSVLWTQTKVGDTLKKKFGSSLFERKRGLNTDSLIIAYPCKN